ncbi:MAG: hypothetical protein WBC93_05905 [Sulfitobacter sp.]
MTTTSDITPENANALLNVMSVDGSRMMLRGAQRVIGVALVVASFGLWLSPGANFEPDLMLMKLMVSALTGIIGLALIQHATQPVEPLIELDVIRKELRLVRVEGLKKELVQKCAFTALSRVEQNGNCMRMWDENGHLLAEVTVADRNVLDSLTSGLRNAGKL